MNKDINFKKMLRSEFGTVFQLIPDVCDPYNRYVTPINNKSFILIDVNEFFKITDSSIIYPGSWIYDDYSTCKYRPTNITLKLIKDDK